METEFPKRLFRDGFEPQVKKINNSCRISILGKVKQALPKEYEKVKNDPVFSHVFALYENGLGYSGCLIHSMMSRQLVTKKKREIWFVFGGKPLRFSMQEFHAVTGLKCTADSSCNLENWKDDGGFWSKLMKRKGPTISIKSLVDVHLPVIHKWNEVDRIRLVYLLVIAGLVMAKDEKKYIPLKYIQMVMDLDKVRTFPWGLKAFKILAKSIIEKIEDLKKINSYALDGFSYAFQIWVMEAIPDIGKLLGEKIITEFREAPRCSNWKGAAKVSYDDIIQLESTFGPKDIVYPYISITGDFDVVDSIEFLWRDETSDGEVDNLKDKISSGNDFGDHIWGTVQVDDVEGEHIQLKDDVGSEVCEENQGSSATKSGESMQAANDEESGCKRKRQPDHGAERRKKKLLYERAATTHRAATDEQMKSFISVFETCFKSFEKKVDSRLEKIEKDVSLLKDTLTSAGITISTQAMVDEPSIPAEKKSKSVVRKT
ncbi:PREDICTED: uncharacterized protein LOC104788758 isoform X1 [Camelina sativa]|uniref:Uncharacterized protein LOC104788758 isoform X1 n=1 Tax=Camelina sativa TaxID=90675 RepID=A0ABM0ZAQ5_CAMSA|nr:PREDICTED: uncharacterized protein LOC104788758 isoform X1 [Camelina sativa]XP_010512851.1 PREDICTED: uncharacterized protein LOC104788758 isoform X1 [Camelina sativa]